VLAARLAGSSASVSPAGAFPVTVACPRTASSCNGTITVRAVQAAGVHNRRARITTLATGSFTASSGQTRRVTLHLSSRGRALLGKSHKLRARVTIVARATGVSSVATLTLNLSQAKRTSRKR
jgi:hypothetical protein